MALVSLCALAVFPATAAGQTAAEPPPAPRAATQAAPSANGGVISEVRLGVLRHDHGFYHARKEPGTDVNVELLFRSPRWKPFEVLWVPRPHLGTSISTDWHTSQFYAGFTWEWRPVGGLFIDGSLGMALHDGFLRPADPDRAALGLRVLFRESLELGYQFGSHHGVSAFLDHISNAGLARDNDGITNLGGRYSYRFRRRSCARRCGRYDPHAGGRPEQAAARDQDHRGSAARDARELTWRCSGTG